MRIPLLALAMLAPCASFAAADCFTVYDTGNVTVFRSRSTPIDLSKPISEAMRDKFPGHHLVWTRNDFDCAELDTTPASVGTARSSQASLIERSSVLRMAEHMPTPSAMDSTAPLSFDAPAAGASHTAGRDVNVRGYYRNGSYVQGYLRAAPGRGR